MRFTDIEIHHENILAAREHFVSIAEECKNLKVNDEEKWVKTQDSHIESLKAGQEDDKFYLLQYAHYLQTGESIPLLP